MSLKSCLRSGCISLTVSPEFFGNHFGDFIGFKYVLYAETLFSCEFQTNFPCFMSIQDKKTMFHAKYIQENCVSCLIWTNYLYSSLVKYTDILLHGNSKARLSFLSGNTFGNFHLSVIVNI